MSDDEKPISELKPDAVASDGILELLNGSSDGDSNLSENERRRRIRTLSAGSRAQIDAQEHQRQFLDLRTRLTDLLDTTVRMLQDVISLNNESSLSVVPANMTVLGVDVRLGAGGSVQPSSSAAPSLVGSRLKQVVQHAQKLQLRLADTTSRVLVTGDLNAGKSSLCNALLKRAVLPVDQQPCTDVFCEVVESSKNHGVEEVHAVRHAATYDVSNPASYSTHSLAELPDLVHDSESYKLLVVYVRDPRAPSESLLNNGVVDVCLIDAPGLNVSAVTTTELFGRQEEIDLVIFVVSAENHFTQSAKEFVSDTAREKSLLFIAVNNYDRIRDKQRCQTRVLNQIAELAPETHKGSSDFVHFVSANGDSSPANGPEDPEDPPTNNEHNENGIDRLESSLRNFVLEKRSEAKLLPARTYLRNVLADLKILADENEQQAVREIDELGTQLAELAPQIDENVLEYASVTDEIDRDIERLARTVFSTTEELLSSTVSSIGEAPVTEWHGLWSVFSYAEETRRLLVEQVLSAVEEAESSARTTTASAVDSIKRLGVLHVGEQPAFTKVFNPAAMFSRRRDNLSRVIRAEFGVADLFDVTGLLERPLPVLASSKRALVSSATNKSVGSAVGGAVAALSVYQGAVVPISTAVTGSPSTGWSMVSTILQSRKFAVPATILAVLALGAWVIYELPRTIPRKLARKLAFEIDEMGYVRTNADRIAAECRKVLRLPAQDVRAAFQTRLESSTRQRDEFERHLRQAKQVLALFEELSGRVQATSEDVRKLAI